MADGRLPYLAFALSSHPPQSSTKPQSSHSPQSSMAAPIESERSLPVATGSLPEDIAYLGKVFKSADEEKQFYKDFGIEEGFSTVVKSSQKFQYSYSYFRYVSEISDCFQKFQTVEGYYRLFPEIDSRVRLLQTDITDFYIQDIPQGETAPTYLFNGDIKIKISGQPYNPSSMQSLLEYFKEHYGNPPIYIHENGYATKSNETLDDTVRVDYISDLIESMLNAVRNGSNARGYFVWSFVDVFELLSAKRNGHL